MLKQTDSEKRLFQSILETHDEIEMANDMIDSLSAMFTDLYKHHCNKCGADERAKALNKEYLEQLTSYLSRPLVPERNEVEIFKPCKASSEQIISVAEAKHLKQAHSEGQLPPIHKQPQPAQQALHPANNLEITPTTVKCTGKPSTKEHMTQTPKLSTVQTKNPSTKEHMTQTPKLSTVQTKSIGAVAQTNPPVAALPAKPAGINAEIQVDQPPRSSTIFPPVKSSGIIATFTSKVLSRFRRSRRVGPEI